LFTLTSIFARRKHLLTVKLLTSRKNVPAAAFWLSTTGAVIEVVSLGWVSVQALPPTASLRSSTISKIQTVLHKQYQQESS